ncbi:MAG: sel1 repeat family protein [Lachnospiraceae bacterium]|nr:sel1 repeat family protein [Lachnospiraceae bacterium]
MGGNTRKSEQELYQEGSAFFLAGDYGHAVVRLLDLADRGHYGAQYYMGIMYHRGFGTEPSQEDLELAKEYLLQSYQQGCQEAGNYLKEHFREAVTEEKEEVRTEADLYWQGQEAYRTGQYAAAAWYFDQAAREGHAMAQLALAKMYQQGQGVEKSDENACYWFNHAAREGILEAQVSMGSLCEFGIGVREDKKEAAFWYRKAAEQGDATAQYHLGFLYEMGDGVEKDEAQALKWFEEAAAQGSEEAQQALQIIRSGDAEDWEGGDDQDWDEDYKEEPAYSQESASGRSGEGDEWLPMKKPEPDQTYMSSAIIQILERESQEEIIALAHKYLSAGLDLFEEGDKKYLECVQISAELGCPEAQDMLGLFYAQGRDVEKDLHKAREWTRRAIDNGYEESRENLLTIMGPEGKMTEEEIYKEAVRQLNGGDRDEGLLYMHEAACMGSKKALNFIGAVLLQQENANMQVAVAYLEKGAMADPTAQNLLGSLYYEGKRIEKNISRCLYWSEMAAEAGQSASMVRLADMYIKGEDVKQDWEKATSFLQRAAEAGNAQAQRALGGMHLMGDHVKKDQKAGLYWLRKAEAQGDKIAKEILAKF